jgi:hypothetical protein
LMTSVGFIVWDSPLMDRISFQPHLTTLSASRVRQLVSLWCCL